MKIVALGNSVTYGSRVVLRECSSYPFILQRILLYWLEEPVEVVNAGVRGDTAAGGLARFEKDVVVHKPDKVLIMFGLNDQKKSSLKEYTRSLKLLIDKSREIGAEPILMTPNPFVEKSPLLKEYAERLLAYLQVMKKVAEEKSTKIIDLNKFFKESPRLLESIEDGVHPDIVGHTAMASIVARELLRERGLEFPQVNLIDFRLVYGDGKHNAFTDLVKWRNEYYLTFRHGTAHFIADKPDGSIYVLKSPDLKKWEKIAELKVEGWDNRDPKLLVYGNKLFLYTQSWSPEEKTHKTFAFYTEDGVEWKGPFDCGEYVYWRPRIYGNEVYVAAYTGWNRDSDWEVDLLKSKDGVEWEKVTVMYRGDKVNETDIYFKDSEAIAFARREAGSRKTMLLSSKYPFTEWSSIELNEVIHSPAIVEINDRILVAGRYPTRFEEKFINWFRTGLFLLDNNKLKLVYEFPSGGDTAYPGIVKLSENRIAVSYYSGHESEDGKVPCNIYLAVLELEF